MNNQDKFTTRSSKLKVHRANLQTVSLSYPARFFTGILFSFLVSLFIVFLFVLFLIMSIEIKNVYFDTHFTMRAGEWFSLARFLETRLLVFWLHVEYAKSTLNVLTLLNKNCDVFFSWTLLLYILTKNSYSWYYFTLVIIWIIFVYVFERIPRLVICNYIKVGAWIWK